jgi:hypothetical protein
MENKVFQSIFVNIRNRLTVRHVTRCGRGELIDQAAATAAAGRSTIQVRGGARSFETPILDPATQMIHVLHRCRDCGRIRWPET